MTARTIIVVGLPTRSSMLYRDLVGRLRQQFPDIGAVIQFAEGCTRRPVSEIHLGEKMAKAIADVDLPQFVPSKRECQRTPPFWSADYRNKRGKR